MITKNEKRLSEIQAERKAAEAAALEEAELLHCHSVMNGEKVPADATLEVNRAKTCGLIPTQGLKPGTIEVDGFVFSRATLIARIQRKADLAAARFYKSVAWNRAAQLPDHYRFPRPAAHQLKKAA